MVLATRADSRGADAFYQKRIPKGAPDYVETARIAFPSGRSADEICPTELAVVAWCAQMGAITFHPWPVRRDDVDHPDELRLDFDPQPGTDFADAVRVASVGRGLLDELGYVGFPKTSGGRGVHVYVRIEPRWTSPTCATPRSRSAGSWSGACPARSRRAGGRRSGARASSSTTTRTPATGRSPPPTASAPSPARPCRRRSAGTSSATSQPEDFTVATMPARFAEVGDPHAAIDDVAHSLQPLLDLYEQQGEGDMPYPPDYPKMPGEPKRVQPSRDRDRRA